MPSSSTGKKKAKDRVALGEPEATTRPQWPPLRPLVPTSDLSLESILEDQIFVIRNLFTAALCRSYVAFLNTLPLVTTPGRPKKGEALRVNDRFQIDDPTFAQQLWAYTGLKHLIAQSGENWGGEVCGLNPRIRIYRYTKGQYFDQHYDESNSLRLLTEPPTLARTTWTLLIYLTGSGTGCVGGETVFYPACGTASNSTSLSTEAAKPIIIELETGMALLHKHGNDCLLHEGRKVTEGEKWVIRSDLCVRR
ncbi:hypothetical protein MMC11_000446 [Xylographa trunciseda]|nr:hypothetical protein [Xylographa trunciseda]